MIFYIIELAGKCHRNSWSHSSGWSNRNPRGKWWVRGTYFRRCCSCRDPFTASWWAVTSWRRWRGTNWWHCRRWGKSDTRGRWWWGEHGFSRWCTPASWRSWPSGTWGELFLTDISSCCSYYNWKMLNWLSISMNFWSPAKSSLKYQGLLRGRFRLDNFLNFKWLQIRQLRSRTCLNIIQGMVSFDIRIPNVYYSL